MTHFFSIIGNQNFQLCINNINSSLLEPHQKGKKGHDILLEGALTGQRLLT